MQSLHGAFFVEGEFMNWTGKLSLESLTMPKTTKKATKKKAKVELDIPGDWDWDDWNDADAAEEEKESHAENEKSREEIISDLDLYLKKGEALMLTAQKKTSRVYSNLLEQCAGSKSVRMAARTNSKAIAKAVATSIFRPMLAEITPEMEPEKQQEVLDTIKKMYFPDQSIRLQICHEETIDDALPACQGTAFSFVERPDLLVGNQNAPKAVIIAAIDRDSVCFGANVSIKSNYAQTSRHWKRGNNGESFACDNIAHICAVASLIQELSVYLSARKNELQQKGQTDAFLPIDKDAQNLTECYISEKYSDYIVRRIQGRIAYMLETNPLVRPFTEAIAGYKCNVLAVSQEEEFQIKSETLDPYELKWKDVVENISLLDYMEMLSNGVEIEYRVKDKGRFLVSDRKTEYAAAYIHAMLPAVDQARQARQNGGHALSYQTKKNIPKETLEYMQKSGYNNYFGYMEVDQDCDLEKISETYSTFVAFHEAALWWVKGSEAVSLRFRRLGNHKATGLWYPQLFCLCVSSVNPSSFIHEYGHMIDTLYGDLSQQSEFAGVRRAYEKELDKLPDGSFGSGKYDINYFLEPTEIFARSLEIYFRRVRGYKNALLGECEGNEYPEAEKYMSMVASYFDDLIAKYGN